LRPGRSWSPAGGGIGGSGRYLTSDVKAIVYKVTGSSSVLKETGRPVPEPGEGEVRVRIVVSGVNPTDWKARRGRAPGDTPPFPEVVPDQDGAVGKVLAGVAAG
jgi:NADPH:quinone reductase